VFYGTTLQQKAGGIMLEFIRMVEPVPRPIRRNVRYGDIGVAKITLSTEDVPSLWAALGDRVAFCGGPKAAEIPGLGEYQFVYCRDPEDNLVEIRSGGWGNGLMFGGACSAGLAVSDLERSVPFYRDFLGLRVVADIHESFSGLVDEVTGATGAGVRSCLLSAGGEGAGMIELFETLGPRGRSLPFSTLWGDFGHLQVAFDCDDVEAIAGDLVEEGMSLLCGPKVMEGGPDHPDPGVFVYARDPDGIPIEFLFIPHGGGTTPAEGGRR
jgi:catechol 2,3-dioxygenase-like lactoylglutathione lyase family enzyme